MRRPSPEPFPFATLRVRATLSPLRGARALAVSMPSALLPACGEKMPKADEGRLVHNRAGADETEAACAQRRRLRGEDADGRRVHVADPHRYAVLLGRVRERGELPADLRLALHVVEKD